MRTCAQCNKEKGDREFRVNSRNPTNLKTVCAQCRVISDEDREAWKKVATKASTVSKLEGKYDPPAWHIRAGSDAFTKIRSLGI